MRRTTLFRWLAAALGVGLCAIGVVALWPAPYVQEEWRWNNADVELAGTLYLPRSDGPHPAFVFVHGWGSFTRSEQLFQEHAERLAKSGTALLVFDKRGCGSSGGDWRTATLMDLARDALGGVQRLGADPRIRGDAIGLFGTSLGSSVALLAAAESPAIAFVATLSMSPRSPAEHSLFLVADRLRRKGYDEDAIARAVELDRRIKAAYRRDEGWAELRADVERQQGEPWFKDADLTLYPDEGSWRWYRDLPMDLDKRELLEKLEVPLFAALGDADALVSGSYAANFLEGVKKELQKDITVVLVPEAEHTLRRPSPWPFREWEWPPDYWEALLQWQAEKIAPR